MSQQASTVKPKKSSEYGLLDMMLADPVAGDADKQKSSTDKPKGSGEFDNEDIQRKMNGVINNIQTTPPDQTKKTATGEHAESPKRAASPHGAKKSMNTSTSSDHKTKPRRNSSASSSDNDKTKKKPPVRRNSSDRDEPKASSKPADDKTTASKQKQLDSSHTKPPPPTTTSTAKKHDRRPSRDSDDSPHRPSEHDSKKDAKKPPKKEHKRSSSSSSDSDRERLTVSKVIQANPLTHHEKSTQSANDPAPPSKKNEHTPRSTKPAHKHSDDDDSDHDKHKSEPKKTQKDDDHQKTLKRAKDYAKSSHDTFDLAEKQTKASGESTANKHHSPTRRNSTEKQKSGHDYFDDDDDDHPKKPAHKADPHSDAEQAKKDKEPKRRRPKRISRTTQTHEYIFRRMEREQHAELLPTLDTDKNIQTRQSQLRPRRQSPKKLNSVYMTSDQYKIEQVKSSKPSAGQQKGAANADKSSAHDGKLLILRPTLPIHHSTGVKVERVKLHYAIDLVRDDSKPNRSPAGHRSKSHTRKQDAHPRAASPASSANDAPRHKPTHPHAARRKGSDAV